MSEYKYLINIKLTFEYDIKLTYIYKIQNILTSVTYVREIKNSLTHLFAPQQGLIIY